MKKTFLLFLMVVFIGTQKNFAQEKLSQNQKLETLGKVWGFLKYYHPYVAKGNFDWDNQLIEKIEETEKINTKKQFNDMLSEWIDGLGKVELCKTCNKKNDKKYFLKNFDLSWTNDQNIFNKNMIEKLNYIEENRNIDGDFYYTTQKDRDGKFGIKNENIIKESFPNTPTRLLELFRYWNIIEYFFPYKYQTDQNWNTVLKEFLPKIIEVTTRKDYLLTFAELTAKTNDTHVFFLPTKKNMFYGNSQIPVETKFIENQLVVTDFFLTKKVYNGILEKFDIITKIDGKTPEEIQKFYSKYIPASNKWTLLRKISDLYLYSFNDKIKLEIIRNGQPMTLEVETVPFNDIDFPKNEEKEKWKLLENNIGYVNIGSLKVGDVKDMFESLKNTNAIIFDVRNYPKLTTREISKYLLSNKTIYYTWKRADTTYPGKFFEENAEIGQPNPDFYKGKVVALVNEITQSQAETLTMMLKQNPTTKVIGSNTAGANGNVVWLNINDTRTAFSGLGAFYPDGRETQRIGIVPDIEVKPTIKGLQENRDELLERALIYIESGK